MTTHSCPGRVSFAHLSTALTLLSPPLPFVSPNPQLDTCFGGKLEISSLSFVLFVGRGKLVPVSGAAVSNFPMGRERKRPVWLRKGIVGDYVEGLVVLDARALSARPRNFIL